MVDNSDKEKPEFKRHYVEKFASNLNLMTEKHLAFRQRF